MQHQFALNSQALECFVKNMPQPAYINSVETGEYLYGNQSSQDFLNAHLSAKQQSLSQAQLSKYFFSEKAMEEKLLATGDVVTNEKSLELDKTGKICFYTVIKIPVVGENANIAAILTMRLKSDEIIQLVELYQLYKVMTHNKKSAVEKTMYHLGIEKYFSENLTEKELLCLLHMKIDASHKYLVSKLFVSKKTIESHVASLIKKSKTKSLSDVLAYLRTVEV